MISHARSSSSTEKTGTNVYEILRVEHKILQVERATTKIPSREPLSVTQSGIPEGVPNPKGVSSFLIIIS